MSLALSETPKTGFVMSRPILSDAFMVELYLVSTIKTEFKVICALFTGEPDTGLDQGHIVHLPLLNIRFQTVKLSEINDSKMHIKRILQGCSCIIEFIK